PSPAPGEPRIAFPPVGPGSWRHFPSVPQGRSQAAIDRPARFGPSLATVHRPFGTPSCGAVGFVRAADSPEDWPEVYNDRAFVSDPIGFDRRFFPPPPGIPRVPRTPRKWATGRSLARRIPPPRESPRHA